MFLALLRVKPYFQHRSRKHTLRPAEVKVAAEAMNRGRLNFQADLQDISSAELEAKHPPLSLPNKPNKNVL